MFLSPRVSRCQGLIIVISFLLSISAGTAWAEDKSTDDSGHPGHDRPTIGLVLGGGGARGGAHIGVIKVLHDMNIPIDYIAGTSMGSVVGALFAIGLSPEEIEEIVLGVDWDDLFSDRPERTLRNYRRKQDDSSAFLPVEWGWDRRIVLASGVISGQKLSFAFRNNDLYTTGHDGFDNLAYPFRAVTTDLQTGLMFVPEHGNLLKAVRASMSIPGVFPPVDWHGRKLVDGYLARNLPVDIAKAMGADIIIAVDVGSLPEETDPEKFKTIGGVNMQKGIIGARQNVEPQLEFADIIIQPILEISTREFKKIPSTVEPGIQAAMRESEQLKELSVSDAEYRAHLAKHAPHPVSSLIIDRIQLINNSEVNDRSILEKIRQPLKQELDLDALKFDLAEVYDFGVFELVDFAVEKSSQETLLIITANPKFYAPDIINFGITFSGGESGRSDLNARMRWTRLEMNRFGAELRTDIQLGYDMGLVSEYYQPLTWTRRPFVALTGGIAYKVSPWYYEMVHYGDYKTKQFFLIPEVGIRLGHYGEVRAGLDFGHLTAYDKTGLSLAEFKGNRGGFVFSMNFDMLDKPFLPRRGYKAKAKIFIGTETFGSNLDYQRLTGGFGFAFPTGAGTIHCSIEGGSDLDTKMPEFHMFTLGGFGQVSGLLSQQLRGDAYGLGKIAYYHKMKGDMSPMTTTWYWFVQGEAGNTWDDQKEASLTDLIIAASLGIAGTTPMGPLALAYGRTEYGADTFYLTIGLLSGFMNR